LPFPHQLARPLALFSTNMLSEKEHHKESKGKQPCTNTAAAAAARAC